MEIRESDMLFSFHEDVAAIKYDDTTFYRERYNAIEGSKGVDIIADSAYALYFVEVKNCEGSAESQDAWRRRYSGSRNMDDLASEIASKVAHTCACLAGVSTFGERNADAASLLDFAAALHSANIASLEKKLLVLLYLEGDFSCKSRPNDAIYRELQNRIKKHLKWLNCRVSVVSTKTDHPRDYEVTQERRGIASSLRT